MDIRAELIRHVFFPIMERWKGNSIRRYLRELQQTESLDRRELHELRMRKLRGLLLHAVEHVPAYGHLKELKPQIEEDPLRALAQFPVLTKSEFQRHSDRYRADNAVDNQLIANRTGGSTGQPVAFYMDRYTVEHYEAARWRGLSWHNIHIGDSSLMIWGSPIELSRLNDVKFHAKELLLKNRKIVPAFQLQEHRADEYIDLLNRFKPKYLYGYATSLHLFAGIVRKGKRPLRHKPAGIVSTAEVLRDEQRRELEQVFQCPVINEYGARDGGIIAYQCPKGGMHLSAENLWLEAVDPVTGRPVQPGQRGALLVTDLNNFVMPRLRYQIGDIGVLSDDVCGCGRTLPLLSGIEGREDEVFLAKDGTLVHGQFITHTIREMDGILKYQAIQHDRDTLTLKLVLQPDRIREPDIEELVRKLKIRLGDIRIQVEKVADIPPAASGKMRIHIREFPLRQN